MLGAPAGLYGMSMVSLERPIDCTCLHRGLGTRCGSVSHSGPPSKLGANAQGVEPSLSSPGALPARDPIRPPQAAPWGRREPQGAGPGEGRLVPGAQASEGRRRRPGSSRLRSLCRFQPRCPSSPGHTPASRSLTGLGLAFSLAGFILALTKFTAWKMTWPVNTINAHACVGITAFSLTCLQFVLGWIRPPKDHGIRAMWLLAHRITGSLTAVFG